MKKGQKVRILQTNEIATIVEIELIRKSGKVHQYCHLKTDKQPDLWLDASELGSVIESCKVTIEGSNGKTLYLAVSQNHTKENELKISLTGSPENLKEHSGLHFLLAAYFLKGLAAEPE